MARELTQSEITEVSGGFGLDLFGGGLSFSFGASSFGSFGSFFGVGGGGFGFGSGFSGSHFDIYEDTNPLGLDLGGIAAGVAAFLAQADGPSPSTPPVGDGTAWPTINCNSHNAIDFGPLSAFADGLSDVSPVPNGDARVAGSPEDSEEDLNQIMRDGEGNIVPPSGFDENGTPYWDGPDSNGNGVPDNLSGGSLSQTWVNSSGNPQSYEWNDPCPTGTV